MEERVRVLARIDELKTRLNELEQQLQESKQEVKTAVNGPGKTKTKHWSRRNVIVTA